MLEIFVTVVLAVLIGGILLRFWRQILGVILLIITGVLYVVISILELPVKIIIACIPQTNSEKKIVREYDWIFFQARNIKAVIRAQKKIKNINTFIQKQEEKRRNKEVKKMLNEAKWVL